MPWIAGWGEIRAESIPHLLDVTIRILKVSRITRYMLNPVTILIQQN